MRQGGNIFLLQEDERIDSAFAFGLRAQHWDVRVFSHAAVLLDSLRDVQPDGVIIRGQCVDPVGLIAAVRQAAAEVLLLWLAEHTHAATRIAALNAGADACLQVEMSAPEWDAYLRRLCVRFAATPAQPPAWRLHEQSRTLRGPAGERLPLTAMERAFFIRLFNEPGHCLRREHFLSCKARDTLESARRVDVLVSRLRSKARGLHIELPVLAVRGWGYILLPQGVPSVDLVSTAPPNCLGA